MSPSKAKRKPNVPKQKKQESKPMAIKRRSKDKASGSENIEKAKEVIAEEAKEFKQFDIVTDCSDHIYINAQSSSNPNPGCSKNASNKVYKKIMQEWKLLEEHLPDSIYVRAFEERTDLLRAVIIGVSGTPYHDGLFFFDLNFPSDYPISPPNVIFHAHGLRLNPNLYSDGTVCLSLLNTWTGSEKERWDPSGSTILQVLLSIQALVLNEEPYYNEPGYTKGKYSSYDKNSESYTNDAFVKSCKIMRYLLKNPPKNFEEFVVKHFRERAKNIIGACKAYMDGDFRVGFYKNDGDSEKVEVSVEFKGVMNTMYGELDKAFKDHNIEDYSHEEAVEDQTEKSEIDEKEKSVGSKRKTTTNSKISKVNKKKKKTKKST